MLHLLYFDPGPTLDSSQMTLQQACGYSLTSSQSGRVDLSGIPNGISFGKGRNHKPLCTEGAGNSDRML